MSNMIPIGLLRGHKILKISNLTTIGLRESISQLKSIQKAGL